MTLTQSQAARRQRVLDAAIALAAEGGYEAVQMREVASTADVALGTVYRYFASKDHLLAAAVAQWTEDTQARLLAEPARGRTRADRLADLLRRACHNLERQPRLTRALMFALSASGPEVGEAQRSMERQMGDLTASILAGLDPARLEGVTAVLRHVWYSSLAAWARGWMDMSQVGDELERAARLLVDNGVAAAAS